LFIVCLPTVFACWISALPATCISAVLPRCVTFVPRLFTFCYILIPPACMPRSGIAVLVLSTRFLPFLRYHSCHLLPGFLGTTTCLVFCRSAVSANKARLPGFWYRFCFCLPYADSVTVLWVVSACHACLHPVRYRCCGFLLCQNTRLLRFNRSCWFEHVQFSAFSAVSRSRFACKPAFRATNVLLLGFCVPLHTVSAVLLRRCHIPFRVLMPAAGRLIYGFVSAVTCRRLLVRTCKRDGCRIFCTLCVVCCVFCGCLRGSPPP